MRGKADAAGKFGAELMEALLVIIPVLLVVLWLGAMRPYCLRHRQGRITGADFGRAMWVDWQQATEIARERKDAGMLALCRLFLLLQLGWVAVFLGIVFGGG